MIVFLLACPTPDTTVPPAVIATPEAAPAVAPPAPPTVSLVAYPRVFVTTDATGAEHAITKFAVHARDGGGTETTAHLELPGVCTSADGAAWTCDGQPVDLPAKPEVKALAPDGAIATWTAAPAARTVPVRLRYAADGATTHLFVEAFRDTSVVASGAADIAGTCVPSGSPPAGREDGNVYLTCTDAGVATLVKLVERDRQAALVKRPVGAKAGTDEVFYTLAPPDGVTFDL